MDNSQVLRLYSRSKIVLGLLKDCLTSSGGKKNSTGQIIFPLHAKSADREKEDVQLWLPVEDASVDLSSDRLDVKTKSLFDAGNFYRWLETDVLGQSVLFGQRIPSTVHIIDRLASALPDGIGIVAVAAQQTSGKGRTGNVWESPLGCGMFSFPLTVALSSKLGHGLTFVQHLVATASVLAVRNTPGYEGIDLRIKWPNDILTSEKVKVGGVLVTSSIFRDEAHCNIGVGVNVTNSQPTICLNDLIRTANTVNETNLEPFTVERFIARTLTELEKLLKGFGTVGPAAFLPTYLKYWLHMNQTVEIQLLDETAVPKTEKNSTPGPARTTGQIIGLDEHGFLQVKIANGEVWSVQSDGNRFDMMANLLLLRKIF